MWLWYALGILVALSPAWAQYVHSGIDTVYWFHPGSGQAVGQSPAFFPQNIFGLPDTNARWNVPSSDPRQICSLGMDGVIVVGWKNFVLVDGPGPDFTVFENAFAYGNGKIFAEPAEVSVSRDGIHFVAFPFDSLSLEGCAGRTPTNGAGNPFDPAESGGDAFDLATLGIDSVRFIKIRDISRMVAENPDHPYWSPVISGFDLDAVVGLHLVPESQVALEVQPIVTGGRLLLTGSGVPFYVALYTLRGRVVERRTVSALPASFSLPVPGVYLVVVSSAQQSQAFVVAATGVGGGWSR